MGSISRFHVQIIQLFACVFMWVHWDACLQYGVCASQPPTRSTLSVFLIPPHKAGMPQIAMYCQLALGSNSRSPECDAVCGSMHASMQAAVLLHL